MTVVDTTGLDQFFKTIRDFVVSFIYLTQFSMILRLAF